MGSPHETTHFLLLFKMRYKQNYNLTTIAYSAGGKVFLPAESELDKNVLQNEEQTLDTTKLNKVFQLNTDF